MNIPNDIYTLAGKATKEAVDQLVQLITLEDGTTDPKPDLTGALRDATGIQYNRSWLIWRRVQLSREAPSMVLNGRKIIADARAKAETAGQLMEFSPKAALAPTVHELRAQDVSWGDMAARLALPEGLIREAFAVASPVKSKGLRIGKGGRFAYGEPTLYEAHRRKEGAFIKGDQVMRPAVSDLLNAEKAGKAVLVKALLEGGTVRKARAPRKASRKLAVQVAEAS